MYKSSLSLAVLAAIVAVGTPQSSEARVTRFVVEERVPFMPGTTWGNVGEYERLKGTAYMEVDPADPLNAVIVNLAKAPRNAKGMVEYSSPFVMLKPVEMRRGNGKIYYGINNRGNCSEFGLRSFPVVNSTCNLTTTGEDNPVLTEGYVWVDAGWHGDGQPDPTLTRNQLFPNFPIATNLDGSPIVGPLRLEYQPAAVSFTMPIVSGGWRPYKAADTNTVNSTLTVRERQDAPRTVVPADKWAFGSCPTGQASLVPSATNLCLFSGFEARKIYEIVYPAKDPIVMGLAYAVTRDIGSFLRYELKDDAGALNPLVLNSQKLGIRRAYSSGGSSTGMYQRDFLYLGFNEDESHRRVFDGVTIQSAGTHRLFANVQFAHPTFYSRQDMNQDYTSNSIPPFTFAVTTDPVTGIRDGILKRPATDPYVMQIDEEIVFWQWKASLNAADSAGNPLPVPDNVRLYFQGGSGHISPAGLLAPPSPQGNCANLQIGGAPGYAVLARALLGAMDDWVDAGIAPPPSNYPRLENGGLVTLAGYLAAFPHIPGVGLPVVMNGLDVLDFGAQFDSTGGIKTVEPPQHGAHYNVLVPRPGPFGDGAEGINTIWTRAPLGSNLGWNVQTGFRAPDLCVLSGSYIPLATTQQERITSGDTRPSLQEVYRNHGGFVRAVQDATSALVHERFMLKIDREKFIKAAAESDVLKGKAGGGDAK